MGIASEQTELGTSVATKEKARPPAERPDGMTMIEFAVNNNVPVEVLERLVALEERMVERNARAAFFDALASFQAECPVIQKGQVANVRTKGGATFSYRYADLGDIVETVRGLLHKHGLSYAWNSTVTENRLLCTCSLRHVEGYETSASFECPVESDAGMSPAQKNGAALTYARRQSLVQVLGITTADEDTDGRGTAFAATLDDSVAADLKAKLEEVGGDESKFLQHFRAADWSHFPASRLTEALSMLEAKRRRAG